MRFTVAAALLAGITHAQGTAGPIWTPPSGTAGATFCSGATGAPGANVTAVYSLGAGVGVPWTPAISVAVAPYGQITFYANVGSSTVNPALVSLNAAGGTTNYRMDICTTYFTTLCAGAGSNYMFPAAPVTDALRVYAVASTLAAMAEWGSTASEAKTTLFQLLTFRLFLRSVPPRSDMP